MVEVFLAGIRIMTNNALWVVSASRVERVLNATVNDLYSPCQIRFTLDIALWEGGPLGSEKLRSVANGGFVPHQDRSRVQIALRGLGTSEVERTRMPRMA